MIKGFLFTPPKGTKSRGAAREARTQSSRAPPKSTRIMQDIDKYNDSDIVDIYIYIYIERERENYRYKNNYNYNQQRGPHAKLPRAPGAPRRDSALHAAGPSTIPTSSISSISSSSSSSTVVVLVIVRIIIIIIIIVIVIILILVIVIYKLPRVPALRAPDYVLMCIIKCIRYTIT